MGPTISLDVVTEGKVIVHGCTAYTIITTLWPTLAPVFGNVIIVFDSAKVGPLVKVCFIALIVTETFDV